MRTHIGKSVSFPPDLLKATEEAASRDNRSFSNFIQIAVREKLERLKRRVNRQKGTKVATGSPPKR